MLLHIHFQSEKRIYTLSTGVWNLDRKHLQQKFKTFQKEAVGKITQYRNAILIKKKLFTPYIDLQCWLQLLNKQVLLNLTMVVSFAGRMVPFDVVTGCFKVISNGRRGITFRKGFEMIRFPVVKSSFRFPNEKIIAVPATVFINDFLEL